MKNVSIILVKPLCDGGFIFTTNDIVKINPPRNNTQTMENTRVIPKMIADFIRFPNFLILFQPNLVNIAYFIVMNELGFLCF